MNIKETLYSIFATVLYWMAIPFIYLFSSRVTGINNLVYYIARCYGYSDELARALVAQAIHETGWYESRAFKEANNLYGMKMPSIRQTTAKGTITLPEGLFASYSSISSSIIDRILWDEYDNTDKQQTLDEYVHETLIEDRYAGDPKYKAKWLSIEPNLDFNLPYIVAGFYVSIGVVLWLYQARRK